MRHILRVHLNSNGLMQQNKRLDRNPILSGRENLLLTTVQGAKHNPHSDPTRAQSEVYDT